ncbi:hypothetical protein DPX39_060045000 [Trypanosoma brucei equiperdum]|uniref:Uncharacterized protein n=1 Tax=Trypanosoma brucei equiperdum TaxID=630700 RepID=A0A3L6LCF5_9TRYP|nr:hypothetical protein DPX39_060045000 [Trypanosoma brucei equiperdum]
MTVSGMTGTLINRLPRRVPIPGLAMLEPKCVLHTTSLLCNKENKANAEQEDREELERERQLRERFSKKIVEAMPQYSSQGGGSCSSGACGAQPPAAAMQMLRFLFFSTALLLILAMMQLSDTNSPIYLLKNIQSWQLPPHSVAYYILLRALLPYREQMRLKEEFETAGRFNPALTFDQFFIQRYPDLFHGYRTQQQDIVAALAACIAVANDRKLSLTISRAAGSARDIRASVDKIMDALRRDYPQVFQGSPSTSYPIATAH